MSDELSTGANLPPEGQMLIYREGGTHLQVRLDGQSVWLPQRLIAELFQVTVPNVSQHLKAIYEEEELRPEATVKQYLTVQTEGNRQVRRAIDQRSTLNLIVSAYLDFAELQAKSRRPMHMADWIAKLDDFLKLSEREVLRDAGRITHKAAEDHAQAQYLKYEQERRRLEASQPTSDFDKAVEEIQKLTKQSKPTPRPKDKQSPPKKRKPK